MKDNNYYIDKINESVEEMTSNYETLGDFNNAIQNGKPCYFYSQVDHAALDNIKNNGSEGCKEFFSQMVYGRGIYGVLDWESATNYDRNNAMVKYMVKKGGFDNFLIFDPEVKKWLQQNGWLTLHEKISDTIKRLFKPEDLKILLCNLHNEVSYMMSQCGVSDPLQFFDLAMCGKISINPNRLQGDFYRAATRNDQYTTEFYASKCRDKEERLLDISGVDGWIVNCGKHRHSYGWMAIFRTTDLLTPVATLVRRGRTWYDCKSHEQYFDPAITDPDKYRELVMKSDGFYRARRNYPNTAFKTKSQCGFTLINKGGKFNYLRALDNTLLSPCDFDSATDFRVGAKNDQGNEMTGSNTARAKTSYLDDEGQKHVLQFEFLSKDFGKKVEIRYHELPDPSDSEWEDVDYDEFKEVMEYIASQKGNVATLNESVEEVFTHRTKDEFLSLVPDHDVADPKSPYQLVYTATATKNVPSIMTKGMSAEYLGTNPRDSSIFHGIGAYCTTHLSSAIENAKHGYGDGNGSGAIIKFALKDGFKNFLFFDEAMRQKYSPNELTSDAIRRFLKNDPNALKRLETYMRNGSYRTGYGFNDNAYGVERFSKLPNSSIKRSGFPKGELSSYGPTAFFQALNDYNEGGKKINYGQYFPERSIAKSRVRGYIYHGNKNEHTIVVRDFNSLMPIAYSLDLGKTWKTTNDKGEEYLSDEVFDELNMNVNPYYAYRDKYSKTGLFDTQRCGFTLLQTDDGKYNYKDVWFHKEVSPCDFDSATPFNINTGKARAKISCNIDGENTTLEFEFTSKDKGKDFTVMYHTLPDPSNSEWEEVEKSEFIETMEYIASQKSGNVNESIQKNVTLTEAQFNDYMRLLLNEQEWNKGCISGVQKFNILYDDLVLLFNECGLMIFNPEMGITSDNYIETLNQIKNALNAIEGSENMNPRQIQKKLAAQLKAFYEDDDNELDPEARAFIEYRIKGTRVMGNNKFLTALSNLNTPEAIKREEQRANRKEANKSDDLKRIEHRLAMKNEAASNILQKVNSVSISDPDPEEAQRLNQIRQLCMQSGPYGFDGSTVYLYNKNPNAKSNGKKEFDKYVVTRSKDGITKTGFQQWPPNYKELYASIKKMGYTPSKITVTVITDETTGVKADFVIYSI